MDVQVKRLDKAYLTAEELDKNTVTKSRTFAEELERIIKNLELHWIGDDASKYINRWIDCYEKAGSYFEELNKTTNFLQNNFSNMQMCRSRTSTNAKVGDKTTSKYEFKQIPKLGPTAEFYYDEALKRDFYDINELCNYYSKVTGYTDSNMKEVFNNWVIGIGRKEVDNYYQTISSYAKKLSKELITLRDDLAKIIYNFDKINN